MAYNTTSTLDNMVATYFVKTELPRLIAKTVLYQLADKTPLPQGAGTVVRWNGWRNFAAVSAALTEGTNPTVATTSSRKISATIAQYGRATATSDLVEYTASLDVIKGTVDNLMDSARLSVDRVIQMGILKSTLAGNEDTTILSGWMSCLASGFHAGSNGTNSGLAWGFPVVFGTTATRLSAVLKTTPSVSARFSMFGIKKVVAALRENNAMEFADGNFAGITRSKSIQDLRTDPDYKAWFQYTTNTPAQTGLGGQGMKPVVQIEGVSFYVSNNLPKYRVTAHSCGVSFIFGKGAYGITEFGNNGEGFKIIIKRPNQNDTSQPLDMYGTIGYKFNMAAAALNVSSGRILICHDKP